MGNPIHSWWVNYEYLWWLLLTLWRSYYPNVCACLLFLQLSSVNGSSSRFCHKILNSVRTNMPITLLLFISLLKNAAMMEVIYKTLLKVHRIKYLLFHPTTLQFALKCLLWNKLLWGFLANYFHFYVALSQRWVKLQLEPFHFSKILIKVHKCYSQCNWSSPVPNKHLLSEWTSAIEVRDTPNASTSIYK